MSMKLKLLNRLLIRVAKKFPLLLRVTSPKNWQKGLIATVVNRYLLQVQWTWQKNHYLNLLSRGRLIVPSAKLAEYTNHCFAIMDYSYNIVQAHGVRDVRAAYTQIFDRFSPQIDICCSKHNNWGLKFAAKIVINTFFNNKQTISSDSARKDTVVAFKKRQRTK